MYILIYNLNIKIIEIYNNKILNYNYYNNYNNYTNYTNKINTKYNNKKYFKHNSYIKR